MYIYEIRVHSLLDQRWQEEFNVATFEHDRKQCQTVLRSPLDQAQLQGILNRIHEMGLKLVAVTLVNKNA